MDHLKKYFSIAEAMSLLLHPHGEVVIHDLKTGRIAAIYNSFSKRKVGDESLVDDVSGNGVIPDVFPVYVKTNWDGRKIRSCTATLRDHQKRPVGLLCINLDVTQQENFRCFLDLWLKTQNLQETSDILFKDDWREQINRYVASYLSTAGITLKRMNRAQRQELVKNLYKEGAFKANHAAAYIAEVLNLSRATVYNYLRTIHENT